MLRESPEQITLIAKALAALGREYARDIITVAIYATPERGGYRRTRMLLRGIYGDFRRIKGGASVELGASANYAAYNEFGTYDGYLGDSAPDEILEAARAARSDLIVLEYGNPGKGLEPRPFLIPALAMIERQAPGLIIRAYERLANG